MKFVAYKFIPNYQLCHLAAIKGLSLCHTLHNMLNPHDLHHNQQKKRKKRRTHSPYVPSQIKLKSTSSLLTLSARLLLYLLFTEKESSHFYFHSSQRNWS